MGFRSPTSCDELTREGPDIGPLAHHVHSPIAVRGCCRRHEPAGVGEGETTEYQVHGRSIVEVLLAACGAVWRRVAVQGWVANARPLAG
jgi:hypothetical protein